MTEPQVASSDARNLQTTLSKSNGKYVLNGRKYGTFQLSSEMDESSAHDRQPQHANLQFRR